MVDNIVAAFSYQLRNADWMDEPTKRSALDKVDSMIFFIGYPEWFQHNVSALSAYYDGVRSKNNFLICIYGTSILVHIYMPYFSL